MALFDSNELVKSIENLQKALAAGSYDAAPSTLRQGPAIQVEDLSSVMVNTTFEQKQIKLQKKLKVKPVKSLLVQFNRQLSYGELEGRAVLEGAVGQESNSDWVRVVVPMAYYADRRKTTVQINMVTTVTGEKPEEMEAKSASLALAADIERDLFVGMANFSNNGVFDGSPAALPINGMPGIWGIDQQVRSSDLTINAKDLMFDAYGGDSSCSIQVGGPLYQGYIEDAATRSQMHWGEADVLHLDPLTASAHVKLAYGKERIILGGATVNSTGADLKQMVTSVGSVKLEVNSFLRAKLRWPTKLRTTAPAAPTISVADAAHGSTTFVLNQTYAYYVTSVNEMGESGPSAVGNVTITANGRKVQVTINNVAAAKFFRVYRTTAGSAPATLGFIGAIANTGASTTVFEDLNNKIPGFVTGFLLQDDTMEIAELAPFSRKELALVDLSSNMVYFRFLALKVLAPRKNILLDNLTGSTGQPASLATYF